MTLKDQRPKCSLLLAEDDADDRYVIKDILMRDKVLSYQIDECDSVKTVISLHDVKGYDVILLDLGLRDSRGLETLKRLAHFCFDTPIVILTEVDDEAFSTQAMKLGFEEFIPKTELIDGRVDWQIRKAIERHKITQMLYRKATLDNLTGVYNKAYFDEALARALSEHGRSHANLSLAVIDVDNFKDVNDTYGHAAGDECLRIVGRSMLEVSREEDLCARIGGDEFAMLFTHYNQKSGLQGVIERFTELCLDYCRQSETLQDIPLSFSVGMVEYQQGMTPELLFSAADKAMYVSKQSGKSRITLA
jgi:diguanylate cyclase (GGDEF)-like protein